jgi:acetate kinase
VPDAPVLVVNAGSTSLKLHLVTSDDEAIPLDSLDEASRASVSAVAHRIVHGGALREPTLLTAQVLSAVEEASALAPLHNRPAVAAIREATAALPAVPHVAVFDTGFHATIPPAAATYAVPNRWREQWGVRRYGFHGLSVQWAAEQARAARLAVCHLGGGSSVTAVLDGRSVDTTMGFSPLEGVPMTTRSGSLDPAVLLYLLREERLSLAELAHELEHESGLTGLSDGGSGDIREASPLALDVYVHRVAGAVGAAATALGGLDALVFTAGIGERSPATRARIAERLAFLGVELDSAANAAAEPDVEVSAPGARVRTLVIRAREEIVAARAARAVLGRCVGG